MSIFKRKCACSQPCPPQAPPGYKEPRQIVFAEEGSPLSVPTGVEVIFVKVGAKCPTSIWV